MMTSKRLLWFILILVIFLALGRMLYLITRSELENDKDRFLASHRRRCRANSTSTGVPSEQQIKTYIFWNDPMHIPKGLCLSMISAAWSNVSFHMVTKMSPQVLKHYPHLNKVWIAFWKVPGYVSFFRSLPDTAEVNDEIIMVMDASDVIYQSADAETFRRHYATALAAAGAPARSLLFNGEASCWPMNHKRFTDECPQYLPVHIKQRTNLSGLCEAQMTNLNSKHTLYLNSGASIGPIGEYRKLYEWIFAHPFIRELSYNCHDDQALIAEAYALRMKDLPISLDVQESVVRAMHMSDTQALRFDETIGRWQHVTTKIESIENSSFDDKNSNLIINRISTNKVTTPSPLILHHNGGAKPNVTDYFMRIALHRLKRLGYEAVYKELADAVVMLDGECFQLEAFCDWRKVLPKS